MIRVALALWVLCATAHADTVYELPKTKATIELPERWTKVDEPALVAAYKHPSGALLAVTRADVPNPDAWKDDAKVNQAYATAIERGVARQTPGYKRVKSKLGKANGVPSLDLEATRDGGATMVLRVLMFRTYALTLAIEVPAKGDIAVARSIASKFSPPKDKEST